MMGSVASAVIAVSLIGLAPQPNEAKSPWESDYGRALAATRQSQVRPLLIVLDKPADAQHRIEPVRLVKEQSAAADAGLLAAYELCHVDASTEYGQKVAKAFRADQFPYVAIIDKTGKKIIYRASGNLTDAQWQTTLTSHQAGELPHAAPISFSEFEQQGYNSPNYCPSCQQGWR